MDVSVIIVNYNTMKLTAECIDSVIDKTKDIVYEVILVDNASTDGSKEFFENDDRIKYVYSSENLGFGKANNLGYMYSTGKYVLLLNSDTLLVNNAIKEFYDFMEQNISFACCGCLLYDLKHQIIHSYGNFMKIRDLIKQYVGYYTRAFIKKPKPKENPASQTMPLPVDYITGADLFIRRNIIEKLGLFDESFFMYFEDTYLQYRYKKAGYRSVIISEPKIIHLEGGSRRTKSFRSWVMGFKSEMLFLKFTLGVPQRIIWRTLTTILIPPIIILYPANLKDKFTALGDIFRIVYSK